MILKKKKQNKNETFILQKRIYKNSFPLVISKIRQGHKACYLSKDGINFDLFIDSKIKSRNININEIFDIISGNRQGDYYIYYHEMKNIVNGEIFQIKDGKLAKLINKEIEFL